MFVADVANRAPSLPHRVLSERSRSVILEALEASPVAVDAHVLADRVGLHVNTVRWHLGVLVDAGLVRTEIGPTVGRGRPRVVYRPVAAGLHAESGPFALLAELLSEVIEGTQGGDAGQVIEDVGRRRGKTLVRTRPDARPVGADEAATEIVRLLDLFGFEPSLDIAARGHRIMMRPCPFGEIAVRHHGIVCRLHLGLIRGALETLGAPVEATALEPFVRPDLCIARLQRTGRASRIPPG